jgi:hypothetical protein
MFHSFFKKKDKDFTKETNVQVSKNVNTASSSTAIANQLADQQNKLTDGVWLKYKEGFINAVRYNIKISELL